MSQGKRVSMVESLPSVEEAFRKRDWAEVRYRMGLRLAHMMDATDSARDNKAIEMSLTPLVDRIDADEKARDGAKGTPHDDITRRAMRARDGAQAEDG